MIRPNRLLLAAALSLSTLVATFVACKSNEISIDNTADYDAYVTQAVDPATDTIVDGPDRSQTRIPAGALSETTSITLARMKPGKYPNFPGGWVPSGNVYSFEPHVQTFSKLVDIKVPYNEPGKPVRLVTSQPGGAWTPVDGAILGAGFGVTQQTHFSFYTVVTGAPPDLTLAPEAGIPDAAPDATQEAGPVDAGPPPPPTLFMTSGGILHRFFLSPVPNAAAGADSGASDGGTLAVANATTLAYGAPPSLLFVAQDPGVGDAGSITPFGDPFTLLQAKGQAPLNVPGAMTVINGELWVANKNTNELETYDALGVRTFRQSLGVNIALMAGTANLLFVVPDTGSEVRRYAITGTGAAKTVTLIAGDAGVVTNPIQSALALFVTPWNELIISGFGQMGAEIYHLDLTGNVLGLYANPGTVSRGGGAVRWPGGLDELVFYDEESQILIRYYFAAGDTTHMTAIPENTFPLGISSPAGLIVAP